MLKKVNSCNLRKFTPKTEIKKTKPIGAGFKNKKYEILTYSFFGFSFQ